MKNLIKLFAFLLFTIFLNSCTPERIVNESETRQETFQTGGDSSSDVNIDKDGE